MLPHPILYKSVLYRYGLAVVIALVTVLLTALLWEVTSEGPFILLVTAVVFSSWLGGLMPGILCAVISILMVDYFLIEPIYQILSTPDSVLRFLLFGLVSALISGLEDRRNRAEHAALLYKQELEIILNSMNEGITVQDSSGRIMYTNTASSSRMGRPSINALLGVPDSQFEAEYKLLGDQDSTLAHVTQSENQVFVTKLPTEVTLGIKTRDSGQESWLTLVSIPILNERGEIRLVVNVLHDITEKRRLEKLRIQAANRVRKVIDNLLAFVGVMNPKGIVIEMNSSALSSANLELDDVIGKRLDQTYWWSYDAAVQAKLLDAIQRGRQGETVRYEVVIRLDDNRYATLDFSLAPVLDVDGQVEFLISSGIDVTARNHLTQQLLLQQRRQSTLIRNMPGIVFESSSFLEAEMLSADFVSDHIEKMLGYSPDEWVKDPLFWQKIIFQEDWQATTQGVKEIYISEQSNSVQFRCIAKDGRVVFVEAHISFMRGSQKELLSTVGVIMDVTERRHNEQALAQYAQELHRSNDELGQFAYVASHDLQEPLRMVTSYLQLIEQRYAKQLDADAKEFIAFAVNGALRMRLLITDLLVYSRIQRNQTEFTPVAMEDIIKLALYNLQLAIEDSGAVITHDPLPEITANQAQMTQLMQNLIGNALKFRGERSPQIHIGVKRESLQWAFSVIDNGIGMEQQYLERIFIIFQRLHARNEYPGTGIGLAICKKIVEKHGGQIYAQSTLGNGTTFHFTIPLKRDDRRILDGNHSDTVG